MATFLPNITDVFAGNSEYTPDWNRIERALRYKEQLYEQGAKRVKTMYDSLFSSAMLRESNIKTRDAYLKTITESLNRATAMDLSLDQNQQFATSLFTPIIEDANIAKDITWTKQYQNESSKAKQYSSSTDPKVRKQYWEVGMKALQYQAEEFKNADNQTALSMSTPKYVPQIELTEYATKAFKDAGISVKEDVVNGGYIYTKKNGSSVFPIAKNFVEMIFSQDPGVKDMLRTQAYVERKDFIKQNATKYGGEDKAEKFYLTEIMKNAGKTVQTTVNQNNDEVKKLRDKKESWDKIIRDRGIVPGSQEHEQYLEDLEKLKIAETGVATQNASLFPTNTLDFNNINDLRAQADNLVTFANYSLLTNQMAGILSARNAELTIKANPFSLAMLNASLSLRNQKEMERIRQINRKDIISIEQKNKIEVLQKRAELGLDGGKDDGSGVFKNLWDEIMGGGEDPWNIDGTENNQNPKGLTGEDDNEASNVWQEQSTEETTEEATTGDNSYNYDINATNEAGKPDVSFGG
jgi:hypothetical protein